MKSSTYKKGKLHLSKQAIVTLSATGLREVKGGQAGPVAWSTSIGKCTGVFCCDLDTPLPVSDLAYPIAM